MKSLKEFLTEALVRFDRKLLADNGVSEADLQAAAKKCGMDPGKLMFVDDWASMDVDNVDSASAEKFAKEFKMQEMTEKEIRAIRNKLFMQERTWIAKIDEDLALEFLWLGATRSKPSTKASIKVFSIKTYNMADADFVKFIK
jgi:hypothetical protein